MIAVIGGWLLPGYHGDCCGQYRFHDVFVDEDTQQALNPLEWQGYAPPAKSQLVRSDKLDMHSLIEREVTTSSASCMEDVCVLYGCRRLCWNTHVVVLRQGHMKL